MTFPGEGKKDDGIEGIQQCPGWISLVLTKQCKQKRDAQKIDDRKGHFETGRARSQRGEGLEQQQRSWRVDRRHVLVVDLVPVSIPQM